MCYSFYSRRKFNYGVKLRFANYKMVRVRSRSAENSFPCCFDAEPFELKFLLIISYVVALGYAFVILMSWIGFSFGFIDTEVWMK